MAIRTIALDSECGVIGSQSAVLRMVPANDPRKAASCGATRADFPGHQACLDQPIPEDPEQPGLVHIAGTARRTDGESASWS